MDRGLSREFVERIHEFVTSADQGIQSNSHHFDSKVQFEYHSTLKYSHALRFTLYF